MTGPTPVWISRSGRQLLDCGRRHCQRRRSDATRPACWSGSPVRQLGRQADQTVCTGRRSRERVDVRRAQPATRLHHHGREKSGRCLFDRCPVTAPVIGHRPGIRGRRDAAFCTCVSARAPSSPGEYLPIESTSTCNVAVTCDNEIQGRTQKLDKGRVCAAIGSFEVHDRQSFR